MDRRDFLKTGLVLSAGTACAYGLPLLTEYGSVAVADTQLASGHKWGMVIDINKCRPDCTACLEACRKENNVAFHGDKRWDVHYIRKVTVRKKHGTDSPQKDVLLLCNHCDDPPCAQVCPVKATYKRDDGIVIVDYHRCIGCRYCMVACPYNVRHFNYKENPEWPNKDYPVRSHGVADSCNFCAHLVDSDKKPACVEACENANAKAIIFGDLNNPNSDVSQLIRNNPVRRLRENLGTEPKVYYIGL